MASNMDEIFDAIVVGGGPVGYAAALALAQTGHRIALITGQIAESDDPPDLGRTAALMQGSLNFLYSLGVQSAIEAQSWPLAAIRMIDAKGGLVRAPSITFRAIELGIGDFGRNISNRALINILRSQAKNTPALSLIEDRMEAAQLDSDPVIIGLANAGSIRAHFAIAADGRQSKLREAAGMTTRTWSYPQVALTCHFNHSRDHSDISTEFHTKEGPFTLVPLGEQRSSLVWVVKPERAQVLLQMEPAEFALAAERQCQSLLGRFELEGLRGAYPLGGLFATHFADERVLLAGEAAHAIPPIGAQGLNLGFRDAMEIGKLALKPDAGNTQTAFQAYDRRRRLDAAARTAAVDLLNRSLLTQFLPLDALRGAGLAALAGLSPLRKMAMRAGMG